MKTPFQQHYEEIPQICEELSEIIFRKELDGMCREDVEFHREKVKDLCVKLVELFLGFELQKWFEAAEKASE
jgi:hypothetical protein